MCGSCGVWASSGGVWVKLVRTEVSRETGSEALRVAGCEDEAQCTRWWGVMESSVHGEWSQHLSLSCDI